MTIKHQKSKNLYSRVACRNRKTNTVMEFWSWHWQYVHFRPRTHFISITYHWDRPESDTDQPHRRPSPKALPHEHALTLFNVTYFIALHLPPRISRLLSFTPLCSRASFPPRSLTFTHRYITSIINHARSISLPLLAYRLGARRFYAQGRDQFVHLRS